MDKSFMDIELCVRSKTISDILAVFIRFYILIFCAFQFTGSLGCGTGYGYLHRIPIRVLPEELHKPLIGVAQKPIGEPTIPYVPPLANTFSHNSTVLAPEPTPLTGAQAGPKLSDAEIIAGVSNVSLNDNEQQPLINLGPADSAPAPFGQPGPQQQQQQPAVNQSQQIYVHPTANPLGQPNFAAIPATNVASLNESFGISTAGSTNNYYQPSVSTNGQGKCARIQTR